MTSRHVRIGLFLAPALLAVLGGCQGPFAAMFAQLFAVSVLPPAGGGSHRLEQGGSITIEVEVAMGVNVSGSDISVWLDSDQFPSGVHLDFSEIGLQFVPPLDPAERETVTYTLFADEDAATGSYTITIDADARINVDGEEIDESDSATFTLGVVAPGSEPEDDDDNGGASASCVQFVNHYNGLACRPETLTVEGSCSASISEFCQDEDAFNACRIENTVCEDGELVESVEACFELCN